MINWSFTKNANYETNINSTNIKLSVFRSYMSLFKWNRLESQKSRLKDIEKLCASHHLSGPCKNIIICLSDCKVSGKVKLIVITTTIRSDFAFNYCQRRLITARQNTRTQSSPMYVQ